jgi:hypothetical protein
MTPCPECGEELKEDKVSLDDRKTLYPDAVQGNIRFACPNCARIWNMPIMVIQTGPMESPGCYDGRDGEPTKASTTSLTLDRFEKAKQGLTFKVE